LNPTPDTTSIVVKWVQYPSAMDIGGISPDQPEDLKIVIVKADED
jgi:hypothetical protein